MNRQHSDLEVASHNEFFSGLQIFRRRSIDYPEPVPRLHRSTLKPKPISTKTRRICGARPNIFYIIFGALSTILLSAGVGSFIGLTLSKQNYNGEPVKVSSSQEPGTINTSSLSNTLSGAPTLEKPISTTATLKPPIMTTTQISGPSMTLLRDCPSSNDTIYNVTHGDATLSFRKLCNTLYPNAPGERINVVRQQTSSLDECINLCATYDILREEDIRNKNVDKCGAVCWRNTMDSDFPLACFGYQIQNSTDGFVTRIDEECDSAAWINEW